MTKISAVIVAHNEEKKIEDCLKSLEFVDEIVVVLDKCSDKTKEIVLKYTNKIIEGSWNIEGERRNISLNGATSDWILEIDADERVPEELKKEILTTIKNSEPKNYIIKFDNYLGKRLVKYGWLRTIGVDQKQILTFRGNKKFHEDKEIHPTFDSKGEVGFLQNKMQHFADDNIADLLARFNKYTTWKANDMVANNKIKGSCFSLIFTLKLRFIKSFFGRKGYKEGALGVLIALLGGLYPLVSYLKAEESRKSKVVSRKL